MRKAIFSVIATVLMFALLGCQKSTGSGADAFLGKWEDPAKVGMVEFRADHTFTMFVNDTVGSGSKPSYSGTWSQSGDKATIFPVSGTGLIHGDPAEYTLSGDGQSISDKFDFKFYRL